MILLAIKHQVRDYDQWKSVFDSFPPTAAGALFHRVNRAAGNPNDVLVVCGWNSVDDARGFQSNGQLAEKMAQAGVVGTPRFETYEEVETSSA